MKIEGIFLLVLLVTFLITFISLRRLIPFLASKKMGQKILDIGPRWHKGKEGTPTMGGLSFILAILIAFVVFIIITIKDLNQRYLACAINIILYAILNAMIGIIDDFAKIRNARNEGLTPKGKLIFQSIASILFLISLNYTVGIDTSLYIPYFDVYIEIGFFYYILAFLLLCGVVNSVNLTDGLDGLASSIILTIGIFLSIVSLVITREPIIAFFAGSIIGAMIGFLVYNFYPARVFMGDTGSLFLGALVVAISFLLNNILLVLVYGFVFICEATSVILQVVYFKITKGKRLFKMAPLHHHFEKSGLGEVKITIAFAIINMIFCILACLGMGNL